MRKDYLRRIVFLVILAITIIFMLRFYFGYQRYLKSSVIGVVHQEKIGNYLIELSNWFHDLIYFSQFRQRLEKTEKENIYLLSELLKLKELEEENKSLLEILRIKKSKDWNASEAKIILVDSSGLSGSFWVNKGKKEGLNEGMNVILPEKILIGRLVECFESYCQGESIFGSLSDPGTKLSVENFRSGVLGILERDKRGSLILKLMPRNADIEIGDIFVTSSENINFVRGLLVARVKEIKKKDNYLPQYFLEPLFSQTRLFSVLVITSFIPSNTRSN